MRRKFCPSLQKLSIFSQNEIFYSNLLNLRKFEYKSQFEKKSLIFGEKDKIVSTFVPVFMKLHSYYIHYSKLHLFPIASLESYGLQSMSFSFMHTYYKLIPK